MNDEYDIQERPTEPIPTVQVAPVAPAAARRGRTMARVAVIGGSLLLGAGAIAAAVAGPVAGIGSTGSSLMTLANSGTTADQSAGTQPGGPGWGGMMGGRMGGMMGGRHETVSDLSVAAQAIGITEAQLQTALQSGQTIAQVATSKGVDVQKVIDALVADETSEIDAAVKAGTITQSQADQMKANVTQRITDRVNGTFAGRGFGPGFGMGRGHGMMGEDLSVVAKAIGISDSDLLTALQGGKSIADVAKAHNVSTQTVIDALVASEKTEVQALVTAGRITQSQADTMIANLTQRVTAMVNGTMPGPRFGHGMGRGWGHDWNGQAPNGTNPTSPNASPTTNGA